MLWTEIQIDFSMKNRAKKNYNLPGVHITKKDGPV